MYVCMFMLFQLLSDPFLGDETDNANITELKVLSNPELIVNVKTSDLVRMEYVKNYITYLVLSLFNVEL